MDPLREKSSHRIVPYRPTDREYAMIGQSVPIVCTDLVCVDEQDRLVLAYRRHACARGWWWMGGSLKAGMTFKESFAKIMIREIGFVPRGIKFLCVLQHFWSERDEEPREVGRHDITFVHYVKAGENIIKKIILDPKEYETSRGLLRYDGTQKVRPAVRKIHTLIQRYKPFL